jgi:cytochrome c-type biogenesis protein CcmH
MPLHAGETAGMAGATAPTVAEDPLERRMLEIAKDLRCTVCQNQPVAESNSDLARDMRDLIREQIQAGRSRDEIMNYFVERYGDYVLMKPPYERTGTILWLLPPVLFLVLAISAWFFIRRHGHQAPPPAPRLSREDEARITAARQQDQNS